MLYATVIVKPETNTDFLSYTITKDNKEIGNIHIERITNNDVIEYVFESKAEIKILLSNLKIYDRMNVTFKKNNLLQAKLYRTANGKILVNNLSTWNGVFYTLINKSGENGSIKQTIPITTASLYFVEPINVKAVFSEKFQSMTPIKKVGNKKYIMSLPNGNTVTYSYLNGTCNLVEAVTGFASLKFILKPNN